MSRKVLPTRDSDSDRLGAAISAPLGVGKMTVMRAFRFAVCIDWLVVGIVIGCVARRSGDANNEGWAGTVDTLANGVVVVSNPSEGIWDSTNAWQLTAAFRLGSVEGNGPDVFARIIAIEADQAGHVYVLDNVAQEVRVFDRTGEYVRTLGRPGEGPGEFRGANGMGWGPDGLLWVVDQRLNRFTSFDSTGALVGSRRVPMSTLSYAWQGAFTASGELFDLGYVQDGEKGRPVLLRFDGASAYSDTIPFPDPPAHVFSWRNEQGGGGTTIPFAPEHVWTVSPAKQLWTSDAEQYRIHRVDLPGDTTLTIVRDAPVIHVTTDERTKAIERVERFMRGNRYDANQIPESKPALERIAVDGFGYVWVQRPDSAGAPGSDFDIFDQAGRFLGSLTTEYPVSSSPRFVVGVDRLYYVTIDDLGVQYVIASEITR